MLIEVRDLVKVYTMGETEVRALAGVSADMALRLAQALNTSAEMWLSMQVAHDLWEAEQRPRPKVRRIAA